MQYIGFIKRFLPFAVTFAAGLLIASIFVPIGFPKFGSRHRERKQNEMRELRIEVEQLRKEKCDLRRKLDGIKAETPSFGAPYGDTEMIELPVPPPAPLEPGKTHRHR